MGDISQLIKEVELLRLEYNSAIMLLQTTGSRLDKITRELDKLIINSKQIDEVKKDLITDTITITT